MLGRAEVMAGLEAAAGEYVEAEGYALPRADLARLIAGTLHSMGLAQTAATLCDEAGIPPEPDAVALARQYIYEGKWEEFLDNMSQLPLPPASQRHSLRQEARVQQYLETIEKCKPWEAISLLRGEVAVPRPAKQATAPSPSQQDADFISHKPIFFRKLREACQEPKSCVSGDSNHDEVSDPDSEEEEEGKDDTDNGRRDRVVGRIRLGESPSFAPAPASAPETNGDTAMTGDEPIATTYTTTYTPAYGHTTRHQLTCAHRGAASLSSTSSSCSSSETRALEQLAMLSLLSPGAELYHEAAALHKDRVGVAPPQHPPEAHSVAALRPSMISTLETQLSAAACIPQSRLPSLVVKGLLEQPSAAHRSDTRKRSSVSSLSLHANAPSTIISTHPRTRRRVLQLLQGLREPETKTAERAPERNEKKEETMLQETKEQPPTALSTPLSFSLPFVPTRLAVSFRSHEAEVWGAKFSHDGRWLATYSRLGEIHLWDISDPLVQAALTSTRSSTMGGSTAQATEGPDLLHADTPARVLSSPTLTARTLGAVLGVEWRGAIAADNGSTHDALLVWSEGGLVHVWHLTEDRSRSASSAGGGSSASKAFTARRQGRRSSPTSTPLRPRRMSHDSVDHGSMRFESEEKAREEASAQVGLVRGATWEGHKLTFQPGYGWDSNSLDAMDTDGESDSHHEESEEDSDDRAMPPQAPAPSNCVTAAKWLPDGVSVLLGTLSGELRVWDSSTGRMLQRWPGWGRITDLHACWAPGMKTPSRIPVVVLTLESNCNTVLLRYGDGRVTPTSPLYRSSGSPGHTPRPGEEEGSDDKDASSPSPLVAWPWRIEVDQTGTPLALSLVSPQQLHNEATSMTVDLVWTGNADTRGIVTAIHLQKKGSILVVDSADKEANSDEYEPELYAGHRQEHFVLRSCFLGRGCEYLASGSEDGRVNIWKRGKHVPFYRLGGHAATVNAVTAVEPAIESQLTHPNQWLLASASDDHTVCLWS